jgi:hypothetical protein
MSLIKRCTWLAVRLSFVVLAPICTLCWFAFVGLFVYKVRESGMPITEFILAMPIELLTKVLEGLATGLEFVIIGVASCAIAGATIGAVAVVFSRLFRSGARIA